MTEEHERVVSLETPKSEAKQEREPFYGISFDVATCPEKEGQKNEDTFFTENGKHPAAGVFDGVGRNRGGGDAARVAMEAMINKLREEPRVITTLVEAVDLMRRMFEAAKNAVAEEKKKTGILNMATTASVVVFFCDEKDGGRRKAVVGNIGDSRVYVQRKDGVLSQVSIDHSLAFESYRDSQYVKRNYPDFPAHEELSDVVETQQRLDDARTKEEIDADPKTKALFSKKNLIRSAIGFEGGYTETESIFIIDIDSDIDKIVITSDGIHDPLPREEIEKVLSSDKNTAQDILAKVKETNADQNYVKAKPDDSTVVIVNIPKTNEQLDKGFDFKLSCVNNERDLYHLIMMGPLPDGEDTIDTIREVEEYTMQRIQKMKNPKIQEVIDRIEESERTKP